VLRQHAGAYWRIQKKDGRVFEFNEIAIERSRA